MSLILTALLSFAVSDAKPSGCSPSVMALIPEAVMLVADGGECDAKGCTRIGKTFAPAKPKNCEIDIYPSETDITQPIEKLCLLNSRTGSTLLDNRSPEAAMRRMKKAACRCGADAVIVTNVDSESASFSSWGKSRAQGIAVRYVTSTDTPVIPSTAVGISTNRSDSSAKITTPSSLSSTEAQAESTKLAGARPSPPTPASPVPSNINPYQIAKDTTVIIDNQNPGSGVIIGRSQQTYYVLTAKHVVATEDDYAIVTSKGKRYGLVSNKIRRLPNLDLAIVEFNSRQDYTVAQLGNSETATQGKNIFVSGWPMPEQAITEPTHLVTKGEVVGLQPNDAEGYMLLYSNNTAPGMSGGPILDQKGQVIGIHGRAAGNQISGKVGINLGIPIQLFLDSASQASINLQQLGLSSQN